MSENGQPRIKPIIILPRGEMTKHDVKLLRDNGICVVEANDPAKIRFAEPPPTGYAEQERAAIELFRSLMRQQSFMINRTDLASMYADIIWRGIKPESVEQVAKVKK